MTIYTQILNTIKIENEIQLIHHNSSLNRVTWWTMFNRILALEKAISIPLVTPEMRACAFLFHQGPVPSHHLQAALKTSPAGFHNVKRRLKDMGIIVGRKSARDGRVTLYDLSDEVRSLLAAQLENRFSPDTSGRSNNKPNVLLANPAYLAV